MKKMAKGISRFGRFAVLNWIMLWFILINGMIVMLPADVVGEKGSQWITGHNYYWYAGLVVGVSYFISHFITIVCSSIFEGATTKSQESSLQNMIRCLDFTEKAVLREFVLQRRSVINLPVNEPAVKNLLGAGILTYAYGTPQSGDLSTMKAMMITLNARQYITYKILGLSKSGMSEGQIEQILNERPKFIGKNLSRT